MTENSGKTSMEYTNNPDGKLNEGVYFHGRGELEKASLIYKIQKIPMPRFLKCRMLTKSLNGIELNEGNKSETGRDKR